MTAARKALVEVASGVRRAISSRDGVVVRQHGLLAETFRCRDP
jgi:hypothetical protein